MSTKSGRIEVCAAACGRVMDELVKAVVARDRNPEKAKVHLKEALSLAERDNEIHERAPRGTFPEGDGRYALYDLTDIFREAGG